MASLTHIRATTVPGGGAVRLRWSYASGSTAAGVRVMRSLRTHPRSPDDGAVVADAVGLTEALDTQLGDGSVYYYSLFPFSGSPRVYEIDRANRTLALASLSSGTAARMYELLPRLYHRYDDTSAAGAVGPAGVSSGALRRFLALPGAELDLFASVLRAAEDAHDPRRVDGRLLPLLAAWLGWQHDHTLELGEQRRDVGNAPSLYRTIGSVPTLEATVKRLIGVESRSKELAHNVLCSNQPERLNWWSRRRDGAGVWTETQEPFSLDGAFDGRPALAHAEDASWLFYHVVEQGQASIWFKRRLASDGAWTPSHPLIHRGGVDRDPTAAAQGARLWLIWAVCERSSGRWALDARTLGGGAPLVAALPDAGGAERRRPAATVDDAGGLWLFWLERPAPLAPWRIMYSRHDGTDWDGAPHALPDDARVDDDLFARFDPASQQIQLWWCQRRAIAALGGALRWRLMSRVKAGLNPDASDWGAATPVADVGPADRDDREPFAFDAAGVTEVAFSSNRGGRYAVWTVAGASAPVPTGGAAVAERAPAALASDDGVLLLYRSNRAVRYRSAVYAATETVDARYSGSTSVHTRNAAKLGLRRSFDDFQTYSYDTGQAGERRNSDWYARDTVALYVVPPSGDAATVQAALTRLARGLSRFMPATERAVFIPSADLATETAVVGLDADQLPSTRQ